MARGGFLWMGFQDRLVAAISVPLLLYAVANALTEEIVFRLALIAPLRGVLSDGAILALCAWIFGVIHVVGVPGGPVGVLMAAFLGWFLGRSILGTRGLTWALVVHGVQDVLIFSVSCSMHAELPGSPKGGLCGTTAGAAADGSAVGAELIERAPCTCAPAAPTASISARLSRSSEPHLRPRPV